MKNSFGIFILLMGNLLFAQNNFKIELEAAAFEKDSLFIEAATNSGNTKRIFNFSVDTNSNISFLKGFNSIIARINAQKTSIEGKIDYPQIMNLVYFDPKTKNSYQTKPFFLEKGNFVISVNRINNFDYQFEFNTPANIEYQKLRLDLLNFDKKLIPYSENDRNDILAKQNFLEKYIIKNPNSFVAFWEIVSDFSKYRFDKSYVKNLSLFSNTVKKSYSYIEFKKMIDLENSTNIGGNFPKLSFENNEKITKSDFSNYDITLIDYWSTTCKPCIQDLPKLVALFEKYKDKKVNIISIASDSKKDRMELAKRILKNNNVEWKNYFDVKNEFPKKLNASGYPLQILVDKNGKIIDRKVSDLYKIELTIESIIR
ncbi:TlpA family protein disulfide reductase [Chryseobacterium sp.]|uniref:TlpA family protein disulfide reductase n=1 Tax=Chryseobacterium sp. TaxID=1871047 RepID=UPI00388FBABC